MTLRGAARERNPDFLGIGVQKAGTTWLYGNLRRHPGIWLPPIKELHYFDEVHSERRNRWSGPGRARKIELKLEQFEQRARRRDTDPDYLAALESVRSLDLADDGYRRIFGHAPSDRLCGEITPEYALLPEEGIRHAVELAPHARFFISLRDPIERNWSQARMMAQRKKQVTAADDFGPLALGAKATARANYPAIIDRWLGHIRSEHLLIVFLDDIKDRPLHVMEQVCAHLGIDCQEKYFRRLFDMVLAGEPARIPPRIYAAMLDQLRPVYDEIAARFPDVGRVWKAKHYG